jgi:hypothetical protein
MRLYSQLHALSFYRHTHKHMQADQLGVGEQLRHHEHKDGRITQAIFEIQIAA